MGGAENKTVSVENGWTTGLERIPAPVDSVITTTQLCVPGVSLEATNSSRLRARSHTGGTGLLAPSTRARLERY